MDPNLLADHLDGLFANEQNGWHSPVVRALAELDPELARWRPGPDLNSIWDIVNHMAHEQAMVLDFVRGKPGRPAPFAPPGPLGFANWPAPDEPGTADQWAAAAARLTAGHAELVAFIRTLDAAAILAPPPGRKTPIYRVVQGLIGHNSYHCGQIVLIRRLREQWQAYTPS